MRFQPSFRGPHGCRQQPAGHMCEQDLPTCVRDLLNAARLARQDSDVLCISFRIVENSREIALMELAPEIIRRGLPARKTRGRVRRTCSSCRSR